MKRNARERSRIQTVNQSFEALRRCVPTAHKSMSKVNIIQHALEYIQNLVQLVHEDQLFLETTAAATCMVSTDLLDSPLPCCSVSPTSPLFQSPGHLSAHSQDITPDLQSPQCQPPTPGHQTAHCQALTPDLRTASSPPHSKTILSILPSFERHTGGREYIAARFNSSCPRRIDSCRSRFDSSQPCVDSFPPSCDSRHLRAKGCHSRAEDEDVLNAIIDWQFS